MFRKEKHPKESMSFLFNLADNFMKEGTPSSLIAAFKLYSTLQDNYPDKVYQARLGIVKSKLDQLKILEKVIRDENVSMKNNPSNILSPNHTRSKL